MKPNAGVEHLLESLPLESKDIEKARNRYNSLRSTLEETRLGGATTSQAMRIALKQSDYTQFLNVVNQELIVLDKGMGEALKLTTRRDKRLRQFLGDIAERQGAVVNELFDVATSILAVTDKRVPHRMLIDGRLHSRARSREQNRLASTLQDRHKHTIEALSALAEAARLLLSRRLPTSRDATIF